MKCPLYGGSAAEVKRHTEHWAVSAVCVEKGAVL